MKQILCRTCDKLISHKERMESHIGHNTYDPDLDTPPKEVNEK